MLISGADAESKKDIAILESPLFTINNDTTFTFWYTMNGYGTGTLTLSLVVGNNSTEVWRKNGRQGKDWIQDTVTLHPGTMKLQFKSTVRLPVGSDLALDDVHLSSEESHEGIFFLGVFFFFFFFFFGGGGFFLFFLFFL